MNDSGEAQQTKPPKRRRWGCLIVVVIALVLGCTIWIPMGDSGLPIILFPYAIVYHFVTHIGENVATVGNPLSGDTTGCALPVSERFGKNELQQLYDRLTSESFRSSLTNYNCGDTVPEFRFTMTLHKRVPAATRRVEVHYSPALNPAGPTRCLMFRVSDMIRKACSEIDPAPRSPYDAQELVCDCSKRGGTQEWVAYKVSPAPPQQ
jgi:hypothetical protein